MRQNEIKPDKKTFGEVFGEATGVSAPPGNADVSSAGGDGPRGADWGDRVGGLKGVAWGH